MLGLPGDCSKSENITVSCKGSKAASRNALMILVFFAEIAYFLQLKLSLPLLPCVRSSPRQFRLQGNRNLPLLQRDGQDLEGRHTPVQRIQLVKSAAMVSCCVYEYAAAVLTAVPLSLRRPPSTMHPS